jgi:site-specific DNA recombinase
MLRMRLSMPERRLRPMQQSHLDTYIQAQEISAHRFGSRSAPGANLKHPDTKRSYLLRTYLFCQLCGRRMFGKTRHTLPYYVCAPKKGYLPEGHPAAGTFFVREDTLLQRLNAFFSDHVFGAYRRSLLQASLRTLGLTAQQERGQQAAALRRSITDTETKIKRTVRNLELIADPDPDLIRDINERRAELRAQKQHYETQLADLEARILHTPNPDLIDALPITEIQIDQLPEDLARSLFEALRLEIHYNKHTNTATARITLTGQTITTARHATHNATVTPLRHKQDRDEHKDQNNDQSGVASDGHPGPILVVPPAGLPKDGTWCDQRFSTGTLVIEAGFDLSLID